MLVNGKTKPVYNVLRYIEACVSDLKSGHSFADHLWVIYTEMDKFGCNFIANNFEKALNW